jgi:hypothetical protein
MTSTSKETTAKQAPRTETLHDSHALHAHSCACTAVSRTSTVGGAVDDGRWRRRLARRAGLRVIGRWQRQWIKWRRWIDRQVRLMLNQHRSRRTRHELREACEVNSLASG